MNNNEKITLELINGILNKKGMDQLESLSLDADLRDDLGLGSLDLAELTVKIEAKTGVDIFKSGLIFKVGEVLSKLNNEANS